jgi:hypothetical protein
MSAKHKVVLWDASSGDIDTGVTITLKYGSGCIAPGTPGATVGTYTETPVSGGAYEITIPETNQYTIEVDGAVSGEFTDIWLLADDVISAAKLVGTGASQGASLVGLRDTASRFTAITVEDALAEIAGASRTTETVKSAYDLGNTAATKLTNASQANINTLVGSGGVTNASSLHLHSDVYYTETELNSTGVPNLRVADNGTIRTVGGSTGDLTVGAGADSSGHSGDITLDAHIGTSAKNGGNIIADVRSGAGGTNGNLQVKNSYGTYRVITEFEVGDLDLSSSVYLSIYDTADDGFITNCLRELDTRVAFAIRELTGSNERFRVAYIREKAQTLGSIAAASALTWGSWTNNTGTYKEAIKVILPITEVYSYKVRIVFTAKDSVGTAGKIQVTLAGSISEVVSITSTSDTVYTVDIDVTSSFASPQDLVFEIKGDGASTVTLYENISVLYL